MPRPTILLAALAAITLGARPALADPDPWADNVVSFDQGTVAGPGFADPAAALGEPTRISNPTTQFPSITTPLSGAFGDDELFSIGVGGSLVVSFDEPVTDDPLNPFGIDLLIFGNAFLTGNFFGPAPDFAFNPNGIVDDVFDEPGRIEVSADNITYVEVTGLFADGLFPTNGYSDISDAFTSTPGSVPADFTKPVDPNLDVNGLTFDEVVAAYDGSGGGLGIDLADVGLASISFVKITNAGTDVGSTPDIDGFCRCPCYPRAFDRTARSRSAAT